ncbi:MULTISPECIES: PrsW family intramembrane metalloprotease [Amycolatopsis]|uniref:Membrane proteinase PrsW, cleaves anti-sigma factor RsiW, M82 family n=2 Tax=Amycolatopsis TaxID=1813 RepID=A0A1I4AXB4_9PSEU|nr:PrsW family intramembrane metalloprotease [Amycolatopsis sacchari]SFK60830.1 Membrane proteinase PrsW, cleaves anti-sigma factor RsiW, M82 family [Amycolatopsis sacchari]
MLLPVLGLVLVAVCGLTLLALATVRVGPLAVVIGVAAALVPVAVVVAAVLWVDRWEPEPAKLLLLAFVWGACIATITALLINNTAETVGDLLLGNGRGSRVSALVSAPLVEEAAKGSFVLLLLLRRREEFDGIIDGIVYAGLTAAGFAFTENIYYFGRAFADYGFGDGTSAGVIAAFVLRGVLSPFTHPLFTALTGVGIGVAARAPRGPVKVLAPLGGYLGAVCLHALWNGAATLGGAKTFLNVYFLIMVPMFVAVVLVVILQRRREQRIVEAALPGMVRARWIAASEVELLSSLTGRREWRRQARRQSGRRAAKAVAEYQNAVTELAFLKRHKGNAEARRREGELLGQLRAARAEAVRLAGEHADG